MASEITYAEVKFKNASPTAQAEVLPEKKKREHHPQKYPPWLPWLISLLLLSVCIALIAALLAGHFSHSCDEPTALQQKHMEWHCISAEPQGKGRGWTCCPEGWRLFQKSCYFISTDKMSGNESEQNCTGMGSHLVVITTEEEQAFLTEKISQIFRIREANVYIGLSAQEVSEWHWVDQTPYNGTAAFWRPGEPSNVRNEMCVVIHKNAKPSQNWNDIPCRTLCHWICEAAAVTV